MTDSLYQKQKERSSTGAPPGFYAYEPYKRGSSDLETKKAIYWDHVTDSFFNRGTRWSSVVKELRDLYSDISEEDIKELKGHVQYYMNQHKQQLESSSYGFFGGPVDLGKNPAGDFPSVSWMPRGQEDLNVSPNSTTASLKKESASSVTLPVYFRIDDESLVSYANRSIYLDKILSESMTDADWHSLVKDAARWMLQSERARPSQYFSMDPTTKWDIDTEQINKLKTLFKSLPKNAVRKEARYDQPYWISPKGIEYLVDTSHELWAENNAPMLKTKYGVNFSQMDSSDSRVSYLNELGWVRAGLTSDEIYFQAADRSSFPLMDDFIAKHWAPTTHRMVRVQVWKERKDDLVTDDPFPSLSKAFQRDLSVRSSKSALSLEEQKQVTEKWGPGTNMALGLFYASVKLGHSRDRAFLYAVDQVKKVGLDVSEKNLLKAIRVYLEHKL